MSPFDYRAASVPRREAASARIAWRDLRSSPAKFLFAVAAVSIGVGSLGGIQGAIAAFQLALSRDLRQWIAADVSVQTAEPPDRRQSALLDSLEHQGIERTVVVDTTAQVTSDAAPDPQLVSAKIVDPSKYPFYGRVELNPASNLEGALRGNSVAVTADLLGRLHAQVGSTIEVDAQPLRISAVIVAEPDRLTIVPTPLPRILLAYPAAEATGLVRPRSIYYLRLLFRQPRGTPPDALRRSLEAAFPGRKVLDYLHPDAQAATILQNLQRSLGAISVMLLMVGVIVVATSMWSHIEQKLDSIAVMKALGATSGRVLGIYLFQTAYLVLAGCMAGAVLGMALERAIVILTPRLFSVPLEAPWSWRMPLQAAATGLLAGVFVPLRAMLRIRDVRPYLTLRRDMEEDQQIHPPRRGKAYWSATALAIGATLLMAASATGSWIEGLLLLAVSLAGAAALWAIATLALAGCRTVASRRLSLSVRHGIANLHRPGNGARTAFVAIGAATALFSAIQLVHQQAIADVTGNFPAISGNLFLLNIDAGDVKGVESLLASKLGSTHGAVLAPFYSARIVDVEGRGIAQTGPEVEAAGLRRRWLSTRIDRLPKMFSIVDGDWGAARLKGPAVMLPAMAARALHVKVGSLIGFEAGELTFQARVAAIATMAPLDRFRCCFVFNSATPAFPSAAWHGVVQVPAHRMDEVRQVLYHAFPTMSTIDVTESIGLLDQWLGAVLFSVRLIAGLAMISAAVLLASVVAATRLRRVREIALFKVLGATTFQLIRIYSSEFTVLGATAGVSGSLLAWLAALGGGRLLGPANPSLSVILLAPAGGIAIANLAGWLVIGPLLGRRPLEILRRK